MTTEESRILSTLTSVESIPALTQRMLAKRVGVALGTTNKLVQSLIEKKWVKLTHKGARVKYSLTSAGLAEKLRLLTLHFEGTIDDYVEIRDRIFASLENLHKGQGRVVFYGAGDVAQICYTAVAHSEFELVGVVDDAKVGEQFFEHEVTHPTELESGNLNGVPFDVIIVASYRHADDIKENLRRMNFPPSQVLPLFN
ncbi:hypothetical protein MYX75_01770 [Acidobacteria bacterium AH-259-A15]|nr:hypothetical protein [Acidobacteria bacterium AH-259-A15]